MELDVDAPRLLVRVAAAPFPGEVTPLERQLAHAAPLWATIARKHDLVEGDLSVLASAWHTDADLGRPIEVVTVMSRSRKLGFRARALEAAQAALDVLQALATKGANAVRAELSHSDEIEELWLRVRESYQFLLDAETRPAANGRRRPLIG
jgi:hypothetical protein